MVTEADIRHIALALPGAFEQESDNGRPSWRTKPRMFSWLREDPDALVVWVESLEDKAALLHAEPTKYFTTPHYDGHPVILVHLEAVDIDEASELIIDSWRCRAPKSLVKQLDPEV